MEIDLTPFLIEMLSNLSTDEVNVRCRLLTGIGFLTPTTSENDDEQVLMLVMLKSCLIHKNKLKIQKPNS